MSGLFWWTGVLVWSAAGLAVVLFVVVNVWSLLGSWLYVTRLKDVYADRWGGRDRGSLASGARPSAFVRFPFSRHALVMVFVSERRWMSLWPTILLPHRDQRSGVRLSWPAFRHLYVTDVRLAGEREASLMHRFTAEVLFGCDAAGVTVLSATGALPAVPVGRAATVVVAYASEMTAEVAAGLHAAIRNGCVVVYVDDRPIVTVNDGEGDGFPPVLFQFPAGHRAHHVQVSDDGRVFENGTPYAWASGSTPTVRWSDGGIKASETVDVVALCEPPADDLNEQEG